MDMENNEIQKRGMATTQVKQKSKQLLGYEIDTVELRLLPYIQYTMMNGQKIEPHKINSEERAILSKWRDAGHIEGGMSGLAITRQFWDFVNELCWLAYVAVDHE